MTSARLSENIRKFSRNGCAENSGQDNRLNWRFSEMIVLILALVSNVYFVHGQSNVGIAGCFRWTARGRTVYSTPSDANPASMSLDNCGKSCYEEGYKYAAVESGAYCFCGSTPPASVTDGISYNTCGTRCTGDPNAICGGNTGEATFIVTDSYGAGSTSTEQVTLMATPSAVSASGDSVVFSVTLANPGSGMKYSFDYGDGTPQTDFVDENSPYFSKVYRLPGTFVATVFVKITGQSQISTATTIVNVGVAVSEATIDCPETANVMETITCNLNVNFGKNINLKLDYGDGNSESVPFLDPAYFWTGFAPPMSGSASQNVSATTNRIIAAQSMFPESGLLFAYEYAYSTSSQSNLDVQIVCPPPATEICETSCRSDSYLTCPASSTSAFCSLEDTCGSVSTGMAACDAAQNLNPSSFANLGNDPNLADNLDPSGNVLTYRWRSIVDSETKVSPGCTLTFRADSGVLSATTAQRSGDLELVGGAFDDTGKRFAVRAFAYRSSLTPVTHQWSSAGVYTVKAELSNENGAVEVTATVRVGWEFAVDHPKTVNAGDKVTFTVTQPKLTGMSLLYDFGDGTTLETSDQRITHSYSSTGDYSVQVKLTDSSSNSQTYSNTISVTPSCNCCPALTPMALSTSADNPTVFNRYQTVYQSVDLKVSCAEKTRVDKIWSIQALNSRDNTPVGDSFLAPSDAQNFSILSLKPQFLQLGTYQITLTVTVNQDVSTKKSVAGYVRIVPSHIIPVIYRNQSRISVKQGQVLPLNPGKESIDPNAPTTAVNRFDTYLYKCNALNEPDQTVSTDPDVSSWLQNCDRGKGIRQLADLGYTYMDLDTALLSLDTSYVIGLTLSKTYQLVAGSVTASDTAQLVIDVLSNVPASLQIQCHQANLCNPTTSSLVINPNTSHVFDAICSDCQCPVSPTSKWMLKTSQGTDIDLNIYGKGTESVQLKIDDTLFTDGDLAETYTLRYEYYCGDSHSYAQVNLAINQPPSGGSCTINKNSGKAVFDQFTVTCNSWKDDNNILNYCLYAKFENMTTVNIFCEPQLTQRQISLIPGSYSLYVKITDRFLASTDVFISKANLESVPATYVADNIKLSLDTMMSESNLPGVLALAATVARTANEGNLHPNDPDFFQSSKCTTAGDDSPCALMNVTGALTSEQYQQCVQQANNCPETFRSEKAEVRAQLLRALDSFPVLTISDVMPFSDTVNSVLGSSDEMNLAGQDSAVNILNRMTDVLSRSGTASPAEVTRQTAQAIFATTAKLTKVSNAATAGTPILGDKMRLQKTEYDNYDTSLPENPKDIRFVDEMTFDEWGTDSAKRKQKKINAAVAKAVQNAVDTIAASVLSQLTINDAPLTLTTDDGADMELSFSVVADLRNISWENSVDINFPYFCDFSKMNSCALSTPVQRKIVHYPDNIYQYADDTGSVTSGSTEIDFYDPLTGLKIDISNSDVPVTLKWPQNISVDRQVVWPVLSPIEVIKIHRLNATKRPDAGIYLEVKPANESVTLAVFVRYAKTYIDRYVGPLNKDHDFVFLATKNNYGRVIDLPDIPQTLSNPDVQYFYVGVGQVAADGSSNVTEIGDWKLVRNFTTSYELSMSTHICSFFVPSLSGGNWLSEGCKVGSNSNHKQTECECSHLTTFASGIDVPPNDIDFDFVFKNASFEQNLSIYIALISLFVLYTILVIWARSKDKEDVELIGCIPMPDNDMHDKYLYEVIVRTGLRKGAATDSKVQIIISGDLEETHVREFGHPKGPRHIFRRGMTNRFVMTTRRPLGDLQYVRISHDNGGFGEYASWYLHDVVVHDVQTGKRYPFVCNQWLALEESDGAIERTIAVSSDEELTSFGNVFSAKTKNRLMDDHLWFSVFVRPPHSRFTRVQRISCCLSLLITSMLASIMWYGRIASEPTDSWKVGPFSISLKEIVVGVASGLVVFPINFAIVFMFRRAGPRNKRESRFETALKHNWFVPFLDGKPKVPNDRTTIMAENGQEITAHRNKPRTLPWWCRHLAWLLLTATVAASTVFILFYGISLQDEKCRKWLTSMIVSFLSSALVTEPLQALLIVLFLVLVCRRGHEEHNDWEADENEYALQHGQTWIGGDSTGGVGRMNPLDEQHLAAQKQDRLKQLKMYDIIREVTIYLVFLWVVMILVYGSKDTMGYLYKTNLENLFIRPGDPTYDFEKVARVPEFWDWARNVLAPALRASNWYDGKPAIGELGFLADRTNRILGFATMRQIRSKKHTCAVPSPMTAYFDDCITFTHYYNEERESFFPGWLAKPDNAFSDRIEYQYQTGDSLQNMFTTGQVDAYSGGGYVVPLQKSIPDMRALFDQLESEQWIDDHTRAVIIEFSCFDANANIFGVNSILIIFILFIVVYIIKELRKMFKNGCSYWSHGWNYIEVSIILLSIASLILFVFRYIETSKALQIFTENNGNERVSLQYSAALDEAFTYVEAVLVFFSMTKLAHLLRFNRRISIIITTFGCCRSHFIHYFFVFGVLFFGFSLSFWIGFQSKLLKFSTLLSTIATNFTFLLNKGNYLELLQSNPIVAPILITLFASIMSGLMINLFMTLVMTIFITVKHDSKQHSEDHAVVTFLTIQIRRLLGLSPSAAQTTSLGDYRQSVNDFYKLEKKIAQMMRKVDNFYHTEAMPGSKEHHEAAPMVVSSD